MDKIKRGPKPKRHVRLGTIYLPKLTRERIIRVSRLWGKTISQTIDEIVNNFYEKIVTAENHSEK